MALKEIVLKCSKLCDSVTCSKLYKDGAVRNPFFFSSIRTYKHYNPKFKWLRSKKVIPVKLEEQFNERSTRQTLMKTLKDFNLDPPRYWKKRPITVTSFHSIMDPYVPPEGDGKVSTFTTEGSKELLSSINKKRMSMMAIRKVKQYDSKFDVKLFPQEAQDIYIKAHETLMKNDLEELTEFVTENAAMEMTEGMKRRTLRWKFIESLEPPVVVHARCEGALTKENLCAQITVRFHTKQTLAIYDRFGRLCYGSEILAKDVLEYVVFEKHIVHEYGTWKLHGKIIPHWMPRGEPAPRTYVVLKDEPEEDDEILSYMDEQSEEEETKETNETSEPVKQPAVSSGTS